jgi:UDP-N-acetylmuramate--alanine ligase
MDAESYVLERLSKPLPAGKTGYLFITMGAGDNWKLGKAVFDKLNTKK